MISEQYIWEDMEKAVVASTKGIKWNLTAVIEETAKSQSEYLNFKMWTHDDLPNDRYKCHLLGSDVRF